MRIDLVASQADHLTGFIENRFGDAASQGLAAVAFIQAAGQQTLPDFAAAADAARRDLRPERAIGEADASLARLCGIKAEFLLNELQCTPVSSKAARVELGNGKHRIGEQGIEKVVVGISHFIHWG